MTVYKAQCLKWQFFCVPISENKMFYSHTWLAPCGLCGGQLTLVISLHWQPANKLVQLAAASHHVYAGESVKCVYILMSPQIGKRVF